MQKNNTPGPGQYHNEGSHHYKFANMKESRSKELKKGPPGPGRNHFAIQSTKYLRRSQALPTTCLTPVSTDRPAALDLISDCF